MVLSMPRDSTPHGIIVIVFGSSYLEVKLYWREDAGFQLLHLDFRGAIHEKSSHCRSPIDQG